MSSNIDRHHVLSLVDKMQDKYQFQDGEYMEIVEALGGKKKSIDVNNAKLVRITYEKIEAVQFRDDEDEDWQAAVTVVPYSTIREVLPISDECFVPKMQLDTSCTTVESTTLEELSESMTKPQPYYNVNVDLTLRITDIEVLVTRA